MKHRRDGVARHYTGSRFSFRRKDNRWMMCGHSSQKIMPVRKRPTVHQLRWWGDNRDYTFLLQGYVCGGWEKAGHKFRILRSIRYHLIRPARVKRPHGVFHIRDLGVHPLLNQPMSEPRKMSYILWEQAIMRDYLIEWEKGHLCRMITTSTIFQSKGKMLPAIYVYEIQHLSGSEQKFWAWHREQGYWMDQFRKSVDKAARGWFLMAESKDEMTPADLFPWNFMVTEKSSDEMAISYLRCLLCRLDLWENRLLLFPKQRELIHQYRVTLRKIRMIFSYVNLGKKLATQLRAIFRQTSSVRDCDICIQALEEYRGEMMRNGRLFSPEDDTALSIIQRRVQQIRQNHLERLVRRLQAHSYAQMINRLWALAEYRRIAQERPDNRVNYLDIVALREYDQVSRALDRLSQLERNEIHQIRIRIKKLRYLMEAMDPNRHSQTVHELIFWQDILGVWLDSFVCQQLFAQQAMLSAGSVRGDVESWLKEKQNRVWQEILEAVRCRTLQSDRESADYHE